MGGMVVLQQMVVFFILLAVGWVARRQGLMPHEFLPPLSGVIVNVCGPCLILSGAIQAEEHMTLAQAGSAFAVFVLLMVVTMAIGWLLPKLLFYTPREQGVVNLALWMTNIGYIGLPFAAGAYGPHVQLLVTLILVPNNILLYTYAIWLVQRKADAKTPFRWKSLVNTGTIAVVLTIVLYFGNVQLPAVIASPIEMLGATTAPLAMMLTGAQLAEVELKSLFTNVRVVLFTVLKMIVIPIAVLLAFKLFVTDVSILQACLVLLAMPTGVLVGAYALLYDEPLAPLATKLVTLTTFVSVLTIPLVALACGL